MKLSVYVVEDARTQVLILKLIYGILGRPETCDFFYTNDLYVLVDIILRRLGELGDDKESSKVIPSLTLLYGEESEIKRY
jgi:hypothetical protein